MSSTLSADSRSLLRALVAANPDAGAYVVTGYVQRTASRGNDLRLSRARAAAVKAYLARLGVTATVPVYITGARVPKVHGNRWSARRATIKVLAGTRPTSTLTAKWGKPSDTVARFTLSSVGTWDIAPDAYRFKWQYSHDNKSWRWLGNGVNRMGPNYSYSTTQAYEADVTLTKTSVYHYLQACGYVRGWVSAKVGGVWYAYYPTTVLQPQGCVAGL